MRPIIFDELKVGDPVITRDGRKGRVICVDRKEPYYPIVCLIIHRQKSIEQLETYTRGGHFNEDGDTDEWDIFLPPKKETLKIYKLNAKECVNAKYIVQEHDDPIIIGKHYDLIKTIEVEV